MVEENNRNNKSSATTVSAAAENHGNGGKDHRQQTTTQTHPSEARMTSSQTNPCDLSSASEEIKRIVYKLRNENIFLAQENKVLDMKWKKTAEVTKQMSHDIAELSDVNNELVRQRDSVLEMYNILKEDAVLILDEYNRLKKMTQTLNSKDITPAEGSPNAIAIGLGTEKEKDKEHGEESMEKFKMMLKAKDTEIMNLMNENNEMNKLILSKKQVMTEMICQMETYSQRVTSEIDNMYNQLEEFKLCHAHALRSQNHGQSVIEELDKLSEPENQQVGSTETRCCNENKSRAATLTKRFFSSDRQTDVFDKQVNITARFAVRNGAEKRSDAKPTIIKQRPALSRTMFSPERPMDATSMGGDESREKILKNLWRSKRSLFPPVTNSLKLSGKEEETDSETELHRSSSEAKRHILPTSKADGGAVNLPRERPSLARLWFSEIKLTRKELTDSGECCVSLKTQERP